MEIFEKFAIVYRWSIKGSTGGPSGYLYNLRDGFLINNDEITVYSFTNKNITNNQTNQSQSSLRKLWSVLKKYKLHFPLLLLFELKIIYQYLGKFNWSNEEYYKQALDKDYLQFESLEDLYDFKTKLKYEGTAILTPHRPEPFYEEKINELKVFLDTSYRFPLLKKVLIYLEKKAYSLTDVFIFPSKEAMELYHSFPGFTDGVNGKPVKFVFTGAPVIEPSTTKEEYRSRLGIGIEDKVIAFIGRHNQVKGYDLLVNAFSNLESTSQTKVVCAGKLSDIEFPKHSNWIELGLITDPVNLINSADLVVLPNRSTYFDLIAVEVIAQGKVLVASNTGGNISLSEQSKGVVLFENENIEDMMNKINLVFQLTRSERAELELANKQFYTAHCKLDKFAENYVNIIDSIIRNRK